MSDNPNIYTPKSCIDDPIIKFYRSEDIELKELGEKFRKEFNSMLYSELMKQHVKYFK